MDQEAGVERLLSDRPSARQQGRRGGLGRLGFRDLQPGGDLGQDHDAGHRRRQEPGRSASRLGDSDQEPGSGQRLHGQMTAVEQIERPAALPRRRPGGRGPGGGRSAMSYGFVALYTVLTVAFGILPALYALYLAFTDGNGGFAGLTNFSK